MSRGTIEVIHCDCCLRKRDALEIISKNSDDICLACLFVIERAQWILGDRLPSVIKEYRQVVKDNENPKEGGNEQAIAHNNRDI